ncbi:hypothetical protein SCALM49S_08917 [Streptomyces californicus]
MDRSGAGSRRLYPGEQLESAVEAFGNEAADVRALTPHGRASGLTSVERAFLTAGLAAYEGERRASARAARVLRGLVAALSVLLCLAVVAGLTAREQSRTADRRADEAEARRIAAVAGTLRRSDPRAALRLSVAAWRIAHVPQTRKRCTAPPPSVRWACSKRVRWRGPGPK